LNAEVLLDSVDTLCGTQTRFNGLPEGTRAIQLPDTAVNSYFLQVFGKPDGSSACECERTNEANLAQSLHLLNSADVQGKLAGGRSGALSSDKKATPEQKIEELYLIAFSRKPESPEIAAAKAHLEKFQHSKAAYEDLLWALLNTKEFLFNH
jgi:hypothetical protein